MECVGGTEDLKTTVTILLTMPFKRGKSESNPGKHNGPYSYETKLAVTARSVEGWSRNVTKFAAPHMTASAIKSRRRSSVKREDNFSIVMAGVKPLVSNSTEKNPFRNKSHSRGTVEYAITMPAPKEDVKDKSKFPNLFEKAVETDPDSFKKEISIGNLVRAVKMLKQDKALYNSVLNKDPHSSALVEFFTKFNWKPAALTGVPVDWVGLFKKQIISVAIDQVFYIMFIYSKYFNYCVVINFMPCLCICVSALSPVQLHVGKPHQKLVQYLHIQWRVRTHVLKLLLLSSSRKDESKRSCALS
jgi:hypothetical protein